MQEAIKSTGECGFGWSLRTAMGGDIYPVLFAVTPNSPAEKSGLRLGDVIISLNDISMKNTNSNRVLFEQISPSPGDKLKMKVWRGGDRVLDAVCTTRQRVKK